MIALCPNCFGIQEHDQECFCQGGPFTGDPHIEAYKRICAMPKPALQQTLEFPVRRGTELELYPNGSLKRYKY